MPVDSSVIVVMVYTSLTLLTLWPVLELVSMWTQDLSEANYKIHTRIATSSQCTGGGGDKTRMLFTFSARSAGTVRWFCRSILLPTKTMSIPSRLACHTVLMVLLVHYWYIGILLVYYCLLLIEYETMLTAIQMFYKQLYHRLERHPI